MCRKLRQRGRRTKLGFDRSYSIDFDHLSLSRRPLHILLPLLASFAVYFISFAHHYGNIQLHAGACIFVYHPLELVPSLIIWPFFIWHQCVSPSGYLYSTANPMSQEPYILLGTLDMMLCSQLWAVTMAGEPISLPVCLVHLPGSACFPTLPPHVYYAVSYIIYSPRGF